MMRNFIQLDDNIFCHYWYHPYLAQSAIGRTEEKVVTFNSLSPRICYISLGGNDTELNHFNSLIDNTIWKSPPARCRFI